MKIDNQYIIHFKGLKEGVHNFSFTIGKPFFEAFEHLEVPDGNVDVQVELSKNTGFLDLDIELSGDIQVQCDRCLNYFNLPLSYSGHLIVRFSDIDKGSDEEVIFLHTDDHELDLKHYLYECVSISMPIRKVHPDLPNGEPGCDEEMLKQLRDHLIEE